MHDTYVAELLPRSVKRLIVRLSRVANYHGMDSEIRYDIEQEALLLMWQLRNRLLLVPPEQREAFAYRCIRRYLQRLLLEEIRRLAPLLYGEVAESEIATALSTSVDADGRKNLGQQVENPSLWEVLDMLSPEEHTVLDLFYRLELTDRQIGEQLKIPMATAKMRRLRAVSRIRRRLIS